MKVEKSARDSDSTTVSAGSSAVMRSIRTVALAGTILCSGLAAPAWAQSDVPEPYRNADEHGVDLVTGSFNMAIVEGSIGPAQGGVAMIRYDGRSGQRDNWTGDLRKINVGGQLYVVITFGGISERFKQVGSSWVAEKANGATLVEPGPVGTFRYTKSDGTTIVYSDPKVLAYGSTTDTIRSENDSCASDNALSCGIPTTIDTPQGVRYELSWRTPRQCPVEGGPDGPPPVIVIGPPGDDGGGLGSGDPCVVTYRLDDVRSNASYAMKIKYRSNADSSNGGTAPNVFWWDRAELEFFDLSEVVCPVAALSCNGGTGNWPKVTYSYPAYDVMDITDENGDFWRITRSNYDRIVGIRRPGATVDTTTIAYDASGRVTSITRDGETKTYAWGASGGNVVVNTTEGGSGDTGQVVSHPSYEQPIAVTDGGARDVQYAYDANSRLTKITYPEGNYTQYTLNARGNVTQTLNVAKPGSGAASIVASADYDATCVNFATCNSPNYTIDARLNRTDYTYDPNHGGVTRVQLPAAAAGQPRGEVNYAYSALYAKIKDANGTLVNSPTPTIMLTQITACATAATCPGSANETRITYEYDTPNLLVSKVTAASGDGALVASSAYGYDAQDNLISTDGPLPGNGDMVYYIYDAKNRRRGAIGVDPDGAGPRPRVAERNTFDANESRVVRVDIGTVTGTTSAALDAMSVAQSVERAFDANGNMVRETVSGGGSTHSVVQYGYDGENRLLCAAQRMNPAAYATLPASACTLGTAGGFGPDRITRNTYDADDRVTVVESAYGTPEQSAEQAAYTANGQTAHVIDAELNRTTYAYDGHDRLSQTRYPVPTKGANASSTTDYDALSYDAGSNVTQRRLRDGSVLGYGYDALGRLAVKLVPERAGLSPTHTRDVYYGYDLRGLPLYARFDGPSGEGLSVSYDALGRMTASTLAMDGASRTLAYQHDPAGNRTRVTHPDGVYFTYAYDGFGGVTGASWWAPATGTVPFYAETYDTLGRIADVNKASSYTGYNYDASGRLANMDQRFAAGAGNTTQAFAYNPAGQLTQSTNSNDAYSWAGHYNVDRDYTANGLNQLTNAGAKVLTYDANGNLVGDGTNTYAYDVENRLLSSSGGAGAQLRYDPLGRLYEMTGGNPSATTRFLYDGVALVAEYNPSGAMLRRYAHAPGIDDPILADEGGAMNCSGTRVLHADRLGSIVAQADCWGNRTATNAYDEYGIPAANPGRFGYTGQIWLPEIGLWYYKARMYSPTLGRFMQTDPIGYADGMNWYNYVGSDPVNFVDPLGLACDTYSNGIVFRDESVAACNTEGDQEQIQVSWGSSIIISSGGTTWFDDRLWMAYPEPDMGYVQEAPQSDKNTCSTAAQIGAYASNANLVLEGSAAVLGVGAIVTSPTGVGGGVLGLGAAGAAAGAKVSAVVSIGAYGYDYLSTGSTSSLVGAGAGVVSLVSSGIATRVAGNMMRSGRMFGNLSAPQAARLKTAEAVYGSAAGMVENLLIDTGC